MNDEKQTVTYRWSLDVWANGTWNPARGTASGPAGYSPSDVEHDVRQWLREQGLPSVVANFRTTAVATGTSH